MTPEIKNRIEQIQRGEVPEGYKKTRVGIVPEEWVEDTLDSYISEHKELSNEIARFVVYSSSRKGLLPQSEYYDKKEAEETNLGYKVVPCGYVTYRHMSDDDVFRFNINNTGKNILVSSEYPVFTSKSNGDLGFLIPMINETPRFRYFCRTQKMGGTRTRLYYKNLCTYKSAFPPLAEQKKIAEILATQDKVIELQERKIDELKKLKQCYLSKMFPKRGSNVPELRFSGFTGDWEQRKFSEVFACTIPNNTLSRAELSYDDGVVLNVHYGDVLIKYGAVLNVQKDEIPRIPKKSRDDFKGALLQDGDVIIADTAEDETTGKACEIGNSQGRAIVSGLHTMVCRPRFQLALGYLGYYLNSNAYHHQLLPLMQGIKVLSLSRSNIQKTTVSYPATAKEQQLIASHFSKLDSLITLNQRKLEEMKTYKKALMQLLLMGIVRVN